MPSQGLSNFSSSQPSTLCLPLSKFSYATVSNEHIVPIPWIHLSSKNSLFAVFETSPTQLEDGHVEDRKKLKILRDPEVMEEIDLHLLSKEAHRSMNTAPASLLDAQVPLVTIIVRVPNVAIKYPMTSGQVRRFQMRFASNEDYYEAMKILSRANVPTVEAGSFPTSRPQPTQRPPPSNILPSDSASQIGTTDHGPPSHTTRNVEHQNLGAHSAASSLFVSGPAPGSLHTMPPPRLLPNAIDITPHGPVERSNVENPMVQGSINYISGVQSNVSLSTGTTLVHGNIALPSWSMHRPEHTGIPSWETSNTASDRQRPIEHSAQLPNSVLTSEQSRKLLLPPRRELPFPKSKTTTSRQFTTDPPKMATPGKTNNPKEDAHEKQSMPAADQNSLPATTKARSKRAGTKTTAKPPATKKPRVATTRKKLAAKADKAESPIPSVEELLQRAGSTPLGRMTRSRSILASQKQAFEEASSVRPQLSTTAVASQRVHLPISPTRTGGTRFTRQALRGHQVSALEIQETSPEPDNIFPCTPADQIIHAHTPNAPAAIDAISIGESVNAQDNRAPEEEHCPNISQQKQEASPTRQPPPMQKMSDSQTLPTTDTHFVNAEASLQAWAALPEVTGDPALKDFLCRSLQDPRFLDLCKTIEGWWETTLLGSRLRGRGFGG